MYGLYSRFFVQAGSYFQLLNPLVFLLFAGGFFALYAVRPAKAVLALALSYVVGACAFISDIVYQANLINIGQVPITSLYAITAVLASAGMMLHYCGRARWRLLWAAATVHMMIYAYYDAFIQNHWYASFSANFGCGVIFAIGLIAIRKRLARGIDRLVYAMYAISVAQCFIRPILVAEFTEGTLTPENYSEAAFLLTLHFVVGACAVTMGMTLLVAFSMEIFEDLHKKSITDPLSGVFNRRGFEELATPVMTQNATRPACIVLADIDRFKVVNDTYGHSFGDTVIAELGALFSEYAEGGGTAGRLGGEEFALLLPGESLNEAKDVAEAIRRDFETTNITADNVEASFTASFGVAQRQRGETMISVLSRADEALYLAKREGRNCVRCETDLSVFKLKEASGSLDRRRNRNAGGIAQSA